MSPVFIALTAEGLATARKAQVAVGGEVHASASALPFSHGEKVSPKATDEGVPAVEVGALTGDAGSPSPVGSADTLWEREDLAAHLRTLLSAGRPIVGICAAGILIRILAPLLSDKRAEPPVLAVSEDGASIVPLLGGHRGANELARKVADALGGHAAVTTAGDRRFGVALDAPPAGWTLANPEDAKAVMAALLAGAPARLEGACPWLAESGVPLSADASIRLVATTRMMTGDARALIYHPRKLFVGLGCERGAEPDEAIALVRRALDAAGLSPAAITCVASLDLKADESAVLEAARALGVPARFFSAERLEAETPRLENPSEAVFREVGCHGVAEGAALAGAGPAGTLIVAKTKGARVTCAVGEAPDIVDPLAVGRARGRLAIVGIGPGAADWLTPEARDLLASSDAAVGYSLYLDLVAPLVAHAERFASPLGAEEARVRRALALAAEGRSVALVSSGDSGVYAMASLVFECLDADGRARPFSQGEKVSPKATDEGVPAVENGALPADAGSPSPARFAGAHSLWERGGAARFEILVAPGISAMQAAAARAGAPLGHDFCAISLSDLLTPWEVIEARIRAAAEADFVVAFYNPASERRRSQLAAAKAILLEYRLPDTPVVLARNLGRDGESVTTVRLAALEPDMADMLTIVLVGATTTRQVAAGGRTWTYTPRGYARKREPSSPCGERVAGPQDRLGEGESGGSDITTPRPQPLRGYPLPTRGRG